MSEAEQERARIVAWLKDLKQNRKRSEDGAGLYWITFIINAIERNQHGGGDVPNLAATASHSDDTDDLAIRHRGDT